MNKQDIVFRGACMFCFLLSALLLLFLLGTIVFQGISSLSLEFFLTPSASFGAEGGILYQIIGSILMILTTAFISLPIGIGTALFYAEYSKDKLLYSLMYGLNGVPSIVFGIFGLIFFVNILNTGISWFIGSIILALMILPTIIISTLQAIESIPQNYYESSYALGLRKWQIIRKVILPQSFSGSLTGLFLGLARAIGETAPIMFIATAFSGAMVPRTLLEPVSTLPTHILALAQQAASPQAVSNAWGSALVLIFFVLIFSSVSLGLRIKTKEASIR